jgi:hypothetical protein
MLPENDLSLWREEDAGVRRGRVHLPHREVLLPAFR